MTAITATPKQELIAGAGWLTVSTLAVGGLNYGYALALTHLLPADRYAQFAAAQALLLTAGTVASASIPWVLAQQLAKNPGQADRAVLTRMALLGNCIQGLIAAVVILTVAQSFADPQTAFTLAVCVFLIFVSSTTPGWLQGRQRFGALAAVKVAEVVVKCAVGIVLALATAAAAAPLGAFGAGAAVVLLLGLGWFRHEVFGRVTLGRFASLWRDTLGVTSVQGLVSVLAALDVVLVAALPIASPAAAGYQAATIVARIPLYLATAVAMVALPLVARAAAGEPARQYRDALRLYAVIAVPFAVMLATAPKELVYLVFPPEFADITAVLPYAAASGLMLGAVELITTFYQGRGLYRPSLLRQLLAVGLSVAAVLVGFRTGGIVGLSVGALAGTTSAAGLLLADSGRRWPGAVHLPLAGLGLSFALATGLVLAAGSPIAWIGGCLITSAWVARQVLVLRAAP